MPYKRSRKLGRVIGLKIDRDRPEDSPQKLAIQLASAIEREGRFRDDSVAFAKHANELEKKIPKMRDLLERVRERDRLRVIGEEPKQTRRMDPMMTYESSAIEQEIKKTQEKIDSLHKESQKKIKESQAAKKDQAILQYKLQKANKKNGV